MTKNNPKWKRNKMCGGCGSRDNLIWKRIDTDQTFCINCIVVDADIVSLELTFCPECEMSSFYGHLTGCSLAK